MKLKDLKRKNIPIRFAILVASIVAGFVFPLTFILSAIMAFGLYSDIIEIAQGGGRPKGLDEYTLEDQGWLERFHGACESPAETAFFDAMIARYSLAPSRGKLVGSGVKMELQVPVYPYRLDFLLNNRLIVEIDGAAYHSTPEAVKRDAERDKYFLSKGYQVLRIPAKHPLFEPNVAISMVEDAIEVLVATNKTRRAEFNEKLRPSDVWSAAKKGLSDFSDGLSNAVDEIDRRADEIKEKDRVAKQIEAERQMKAYQEELQADERLREIFKKFK